MFIDFRVFYFYTVVYFIFKAMIKNKNLRSNVLEILELTRFFVNTMW